MGGGRESAEKIKDINTKKTVMSMLSTERMDQQQNAKRTPVAGKPKKPATKGEVLSHEKKRLVNVVVESRLREVVGETEAGGDEEKERVLKENAGTNFKLQPYEGKYDTDEYVREVIKRDTGHIISLKTADSINKRHDDKIKVSTLIYKSDLQEMHLNKIELPKYKPHMIDIQSREKKSMKDTSRQREIEVLTNKLYRVDKVKNEMSKYSTNNYIDGSVSRKVDSMISDMKVNVMMADDRMNEDMYEQDDDLRVSGVEDVKGGSDGEVENGKRGNVVVKEDEFDDEVDVRPSLLEGDNVDIGQEDGNNDDNLGDDNNLVIDEENEDSKQEEGENDDDNGDSKRDDEEMNIGLELEEENSQDDNKVDHNDNSNDGGFEFRMDENIEQDNKSINKKKDDGKKNHHKQKVLNDNTEPLNKQDNGINSNIEDYLKKRVESKGKNPKQLKVENKKLPEPELKGNNKKSIKKKTKNDDKDFEELEINSDIDMRFLESYEYQYDNDNNTNEEEIIEQKDEEKEANKVEIQDTIQPSIHLDDKNRETIIQEKMKKKQEEIDRKYSIKTVKIEDTIDKIKQRERELKIKWEEEEKLKEAKRRREEALFKQSLNPIQLSKLHIQESCNMIEDIKNKVSKIDVHESIVHKETMDKINSRFKHHAPLPASKVATGISFGPINPTNAYPVVNGSKNTHEGEKRRENKDALMDTRDRMKNMLDDAEKNIRYKYNDASTDVRPISLHDASYRIQYPLSDDHTNKVGKGERGGTTGESRKGEKKSMVSPQLDEDTRNRIIRDIIKKPSEDHAYTHPWLEFD